MKNEKLMKTEKINFVKNIFNRKLQSIIFFVTSACNSRCLGCFNWRNLNHKNNLTIKEIEKISRNMPEFEHVLFSGGEPTLRQDLPEICQIFRKNNNIKSISIPTNGLLPERVTQIVEKILIKNPGLNVGVHFSLDGMEKTHEFLRGVKGNFKKVSDSIKKVSSLKKRYPNLDITINTVISNKNYKEIGKLIEFAKSFDVDDHTFDLLRGNIKSGTGLALPSLKEIEKINKLRIKTKKYYSRRRGFFHRIFSLTKEYYLIKSQMRVLRNKKIQFRCIASRSTAVINHDGTMGLCELLPSTGDLRDENYDFNKIWNNESSLIQRKRIKNHKCDCTHTCFLSQSIDHSPLTIFLKMPINYLLRK